MQNEFFDFNYDYGVQTADDYNKKRLEFIDTFQQRSVRTHLQHRESDDKQGCVVKLNTKSLHDVKPEERKPWAVTAEAAANFDVGLRSQTAIETPEQLLALFTQWFNADNVPASRLFEFSTEPRETLELFTFGMTHNTWNSMQTLVTFVSVNMRAWLAQEAAAMHWIVAYAMFDSLYRRLVEILLDLQKTFESLQQKLIGKVDMSLFLALLLPQFMLNMPWCVVAKLPDIDPSNKASNKAFLALLQEDTPRPVVLQLTVALYKFASVSAFLQRLDASDLADLQTSWKERAVFMNEADFRTVVETQFLFFFLDSHAFETSADFARYLGGK